MQSNLFYDGIAQRYSDISLERCKYNNAIDNYITSHDNYYSFLNVLDVGSGEGERIAKLFPGSAKITAVEESKEMCRTLRRNRKIQRVIESDSEELRVADFADNYDLITMQWNVMGHVKNPVLLLRLLYEVLDSSGLLIFDVNNPLNVSQYGIKSFLSNYAYFFLFPREKRRTFNWTLGELSTSVSFSPTRVYIKWLKSVGFKDIKVRYFDYETGDSVAPFAGQILIEARKN
jgi:SAM-dependent methyltransferase